MKFETFIGFRKSVGGDIGQFCSIIEAQVPKPESNRLSSWKEWLRNRGAPSEVIGLLERAWYEYESAERARQAMNGGGS